jgi:hypothetical protein
MNIKVTVDDFSMVHGFKSFKLANNQAVRNTLNKAAGFTRNEAIKEIKKDFTLRNTFTVRSVVYDKVKQTEISKMQSSIGALKRASYMRTQELGGFKRGRSRGGQIEGSVKTNSAIPMNTTREGSSSSRPVMTGNYTQKIKRQMVKGSFKRPGLSPSSRAVAVMAVGKKYNMFISRGNSIFAVKSFIKTGRNSVSAQLEHLYTIHNNPIRIVKREWLNPSVQKASRNLEAVYRWELKRLWKEGNIK